MGFFPSAIPTPALDGAPPPSSTVWLSFAGASALIPCGCGGGQSSFRCSLLSPQESRLRLRPFDCFFSFREPCDSQACWSSLQQALAVFLFWGGSECGIIGCWVAGVSVCGSLPCGLLHWLRVLGFEAPDPSLFSQLVQGVAGPGDCSQFSFWIGCIHACGVEGRYPSHFPPHLGSYFRKV